MAKNPILGALFSEPDVRDYVAKTKNTEFPDEFELKLPKVKNQGNVNSCVAHALSTAVEYFDTKEKGSYTQMSTGYIYGNRRFSLHKGEGMYTRDAIKTVTKYGDVPNVYFPHNVEVPEAIEKFEKESDAIELEGYYYKLKEYFKLNSVQAIKTSLMENGPVIMAMPWYSDIKVVDGVMQTAEDPKTKLGGHCMVIYGWNENGWKVRNSWGRNWGDKGNVVIPYEIKLSETWAIKDAEADSTLTIEKPFSSKFGRAIAKIFNSILLFFFNIGKK